MLTHTAKRPLPGRHRGGYVPRRDRSDRRAAAALASGRAEGLSAFQSADRMFAAIGGTFRAINSRKRRAEEYLIAGPAAARSKYADLAAALPDDFAIAVAVLTGTVASLKSALLDADANLRTSPHHARRLVELENLEVALLVLRFLRATGRASVWPRLRAALISPLWNPVSVSDDGCVIEFEPNYVEWEG